MSDNKPSARYVNFILYDKHACALEHTHFSYLEFLSNDTLVYRPRTRAMSFEIGRIPSFKAFELFKRLNKHIETVKTVGYAPTFSSSTINSVLPAFSVIAVNAEIEDAIKNIKINELSELVLLHRPDNSIPPMLVDAESSPLIAGASYSVNYRRITPILRELVTLVGAPTAALMSSEEELFDGVELFNVKANRSIVPGHREPRGLSTVIEEVLDKERHGAIIRHLFLEMYFNYELQFTIYP